MSPEVTCLPFGSSACLLTCSRNTRPCPAPETAIHPAQALLWHRSHHMEPTPLQPLCSSAWAQTWKGDNQTLPWVEVQLRFKSQENRNESKFVHSPPSLLPCLSPPKQLSKAGQFLDPAHLSHFAPVLPLLLQGLSPLQNGLKGTVASPLCERALPAPSALGHTQASHTSLPAVTCFPTHPGCKGRARPWLSSSNFSHA